MTTAKLAEIGGSDTVKPLNFKAMSAQKNRPGNQSKQSAVGGFLGSAGASDAITGYRNNDVTANMVNGKHDNPAVLRPPQERRAVKASSKVSW